MTKQRMLLIIKSSIENDCFLLVHFNQQDYTSRFFVRIVDVCHDLKNKRLSFICNAFSRQHHADKVFDEIIMYFDKIISLELLKDETAFKYKPEVKKHLLDEMDKLIQYFSNERFNDLNSLLDYYIEASGFDYSLLVQSGKTIPGIDLEVLNNLPNHIYKLNYKQYESLMNILIKRNKTKRTGVWLYLAELSIKVNNKNFPLVYHPFKFDLENATLTYDETVHFNDLLNDDYINVIPVSLKYNCTFERFKDVYLMNKEEAMSMLNISKQATINLNPICLVLEDALNKLNIFQFIKNRYELNQLSDLANMAFGFKSNEKHLSTIDINFINSNDSQKEAIKVSNTYPISYIFGPPGTGKSYTLVSLLIQTIVERKRALICANANHPLDEIESKIRSFYNSEHEVFIPYFRIGNIEKIAESIDYIRMVYKKFLADKKEYKPLNTFNKFNDTNAIDLAKLQNIGYKHLTRLSNNAELLKIICYKDDENGGINRAIKELKKYISNKSNLSLFLSSFPIIISTCSSTSKLALDFDIFDKVLIDEAASCPLTSALSPMIRGKRLVLSGDKKQLNAFTLIDNKINDMLLRQHNIDPLYSYNNLSILDFIMLKTDYLPSTMLNEHYRSQRDIINFCNKYFYKNKMIIKTKQDNLKQHLFVYNIKNNQAINNVSVNECLFIVEYINSNNLNLEDIGIITPFVLQSQAIKRALKKYFPDDYHKASVGTVHSFQGDQKDIIFFSLSCNTKTSINTINRFISDQPLINVSVSRAKKLFIAIGDFNVFNQPRIFKPNYWELLKEYAISLATYKEIDNLEIKDITVKRNNKSSTLNKSESDFYQTLKQILSVLNGEYELKPHVYLSKLFENQDIKEDYKNFHIDFLIKIGDSTKYVAIELDGKEHELDKEKIKNDMKKELLLNSNINIVFLRFKNEERLLYTYIKMKIKRAIDSLNTINAL